MSSYDSLSSKIAKRDITCGVVGLGYVGLPLAVEMGKAGLRVIGFEVSPAFTLSTMRGETSKPITRSPALPISTASGSPT